MSAEQTIINEPESQITKLSTRPKASRSGIIKPTKTNVTDEWLEEIRPEWEGKVQDFDESIAFAVNSSYYMKKPDKQSYILGFLKRAAVRHQEYLETKHVQKFSPGASKLPAKVSLSSTDDEGYMRYLKAQAKLGNESAQKELFSLKENE